MSVAGKCKIEGAILRQACARDGVLRAKRLADCVAHDRSAAMLREPDGANLDRSADILIPDQCHE